MSIDDTEVKEFEEKYKSILFDNIHELSSKQARIILQIQKIGKYIDLESDLTNVGFTLNNKLGELQHEFKHAGLSIYSQKHEEDGFVSTSFIGDAIIEDLISYAVNATKHLSDYDKKMSEISNKKVEQVQALENVSPLRRLLSRIKNFFVPVKQEEMLYTEEETDVINTHLADYKDTTNKLWGYNLKDDIITSIVKKIRKQEYLATTVPKLVKECVIPDLQKLGLSDLIPKLQEAIIEEYKKDLPDPEIYQASEDMYVPDFKSKSTKRSLSENGVMIDDSDNCLE